MSRSVQPNSVSESVQVSIEAVGAGETERRLLEQVHNSTGETQRRALAALGELRQITDDYDIATDADCCGAVGWGATGQLVKIHGRVLCRQCAVEFDRTQG